MPALQPAVLKTLGDEKSGDGSDSGEENEDSGLAMSKKITGFLLT